MSELILEKKHDFRWRLLAETSALALMGYVATIPVVKAEDGERPTVWIEVGGQLDRVTGQAEAYEPPFAVVGAQHGLLPVGNLEAEPRFNLGEQGAISFQPQNTDWNLSVSVQYGRANKHEYRHQQNPISVVLANGQVQHVGGYNVGDQGTALAGAVSQTSDYAVKTKVSHAIVDFKVGKDVGLGLWKRSLPGEIAFGVRFAQFSSHSKMNLNGIPNPHFANYGTVIPGYPKYLSQGFSVYRAQPEITRSFSGWGPTISWNGSVPVTEENEDGAGITLDFAANAGVLFGRQKMQINHHTSGDMYASHFFDPLLNGGSKYSHDHYVNSTVKARSRSVVVPNIGGLAGLSFKLARAKVSVGYRADFFFGAMDGGIESPKSIDRNFYGPFATISIGLGD